jgi:hypothetical protein
MSERKTIKFTPELALLVKSGQKTSTWRLFDDKDLQTGDIVDLIQRPELTVFASAELVEVIEKSLAEMDEADFDGHEKYDSLEEMISTLQQFYPETITPKTKAKVIKFKIIELK